MRLKRKKQFSGLIAPAVPVFLAFGLFLLISMPLQVKSEEVKRAQLQVSGYGFFGNRELKRALRILGEPGKQQATYSANFIEDSVLILMSRITGDGYLKPVIKGHFTLEDGTVEEYQWDSPVEEPLPRTLKAQKVHFTI